jgi:dCMP deaminase
MINIRQGNGRGRASWEQFAMQLAEGACCRSEDPYVQVGACALRHDHSVCGIGYNGAPPGINIDWSDREARRAKVIHAEMNCLNYVRPGEAYLIAVTMSPCCDCLRHIAAKGIKCVVYKQDYTDISEAEELAKEFGITMVKVVI